MITPSTVAKIFQEASVELKVELLTVHQVKYIEFMELVANRLNEASKANRKKPGPKKQPKVKEEKSPFNFNNIWSAWLKRDGELPTPASIAFYKTIKTQHEYEVELPTAIYNYRELQTHKEAQNSDQREYRVSFPKFMSRWRDYLSLTAEPKFDIDSESF